MKCNNREGHQISWDQIDYISCPMCEMEKENKRLIKLDLILDEECSKRMLRIYSLQKQIKLMREELEWIASWNKRAIVTTITDAEYRAKEILKQIKE